MIAPLATASFGITAFTVFALGLRHGADPDHLAAIDNLTRNSLTVRDRMARLVGALFAGGHSIMVLSIAAIAGFLGSRLAVHGALIEAAGTWVSIATLFGIAALNIRQLAAGRTGALGGFKNALLPSALRAASSPLAAVPIGLLFGLGFDTSSQVAAYALAFTKGGGVVAAALIGLIFSLGMAVTDTLDSMIVYKLCVRSPLELERTTRAWIVAVTGFALAIGAYELAQSLGWQSPVPDLAVSIALVASLLAVFAWTYRAIRSGPGRDERTYSPAAGRCPAATVPLEATR